MSLGIKYRTGRFTDHEDELIRQTIREYMERNNIDEDELKTWFSKSNRNSNPLERRFHSLWVAIAVRLETRPVHNIYLHLRRMYHPNNNVGVWSKEDDEKLVRLYAKYKGQWTIIGDELGRMADSCRDRYRNFLKDKETANKGAWTPEEDERLLDIMREVLKKQGKSFDGTTFPWTVISEKMNGTRSRHQCRWRYTLVLRNRMEKVEFVDSKLTAIMKARRALNKGSGEKRSQDLDEHEKAILRETKKSILRGEESQQALAKTLRGALADVLTNDPSKTLEKNETSKHSRHGMKQASYQLLDALKMVIESGKRYRPEVDWDKIAKKLRSRVEESSAAPLAKITSACELLRSQMGKHTGDDEESIAATAAYEALKAAEVAAQAESMRVRLSTIEGHRIRNGLEYLRLRIGNKNGQYKDIIPFMVAKTKRHLEKSKYAKDANIQAAIAGLDGPISDTSLADMMSQQAIIDVACDTALQTLETRFPLWMSEDDDEATSALASISMSLEMVNDALTKSDLPPIEGRSLRRRASKAAKVAEVFRTDEYLTDTDISDDDVTKNEESDESSNEDD